MKKVLLAVLLTLLFIGALNSAPLFVWYNPYPGIDDAVGEKFCSAVKKAISQSDEIKVVFDDNPDHVFNLCLWTINPDGSGGKNAQTCFTYELFFCVAGLPKLYVNSYVECTSPDGIEKTAGLLVKKILENADTFFTGYPQYNKMGKVIKE